MPSSTGVVQEAGAPLRPSISTRQRRQEPNGSRLSVAQSFGIGLSISAAAAMTEAPAGTLTLRPSMGSVTLGSPSRIGVPRSSSCKSAMAELLFRRGARGRPGEVFAEMVEGAEDGQRRQPAERAKRTVRHHLAKIAQKFDVLLAVQAGDDLVDGFGPARRADAAGGTLAAAFLGAEMKGETRLAGHVDAIVEDHDSAVAEDALGGQHRFVVERGVEQRLWKIGAERSADLDRADRAARARPTAEAFDQLADRRAECKLDEAAVADVARELERLRTERPPDAIVRVGFRAMLQNPGDRGETQDVVDDRRPAEQPGDRGQGRLRAHLAALALEALEHRGLLAAD